MSKIFSKSLNTLAKEIQNGVISPVEVVESLLERIDEIDPLLNTYITIDREQVLLDAKEKEKEIRKGIYKGPLHGIPLGIKDNIYTSQLTTTMGSEIYKNFIPKKDAHVIRSLKKSGAIIMGKQNIHQFAYGPTGDRSHVGPVKNPYNLLKMGGGSSSGSAAAVSACLCYGALGTDTSGSIRIPASFCGIVGMKPTVGTVSNRDVYPLAWNLDHVGPMTRTVTDNALLLNEISVHDPNDPRSIFREKEDFTRLIGKSIKSKVIGVPLKTFFYDGVQEEIVQSIKNVIKLLKEAGALIKYVNLPQLENFRDMQRIIIQSEAYTIHEKNLQKYPDLYDEEVSERLFTGTKPKAYEYANALRMQQYAKEKFHQVLDTCDLLITPTMAIHPPDVGARYVTADRSEDNHIRWTITKLTAVTNFNGLPSLSIPSGYSEDGLPIGVQLIGREFSEATLYQFGYVIEELLSLNPAKININ